MPFLRLLRPKQWSKNLLVFAAILFTNELRDSHALLHTFMAFFGMCLISSAAYIANDIRDVEKDRAHPRKKHRPIASGGVSVVAAVVEAMIVLAVGAVLIILLGREAIAVVLAYAALQLIYNLVGKETAVLDVFLISAGFVLRAVLGAAAINREISAWLLLCTGALALLLGFGKRRSEFISQGDRRSESRVSLAGYSRQSLDALVVMASTAAALCYGIYALESPTAHRYPALVITTVFVFYGICRYVLRIFREDEGAEPETILYRDLHILFSVILFVASAIAAMNMEKIPFID